MKQEKKNCVFWDSCNAFPGSLSSWRAPKNIWSAFVIYILLTIPYSVASDDNKGGTSDSSQP